MKQFFSKRINLLLSVTLVFALIFVLIAVVIPSAIFSNNLEDLKTHLRDLTYEYDPEIGPDSLRFVEVDSTERVYVYLDGESEMLIDTGTIYDVDLDVEVHLIHWSHDQTVPEQFYEDDFQARNFVYYIKVIEDEHYVIAFADTSEMIDFVDNFRILSIIIVLVLYIGSLIFTSTYLSTVLVKKYSFYDPSSELNSKVAFFHNYDKRDMKDYQITYHVISNIEDIINKFGFSNSNKVHLDIKRKLLSVYKFENIYQLSESEFIILCTLGENAHENFKDAINAVDETETIVQYEFRVKSVLVDQDIALSLDGKTLINRIQYALFNSKNDITHVDQALFDQLNEELYYQSKLQEAIESKKLINYYQIKVNPNTNKAIGAEALSRWIDDDTLVSPTKYIHLAESSGLIYNIDLISFENTCKSVSTLMELEGMPSNFRLSTNFSPLTLKNLSLDTIKEIIKETKTDPSRISIEVTESVALEFSKIEGILDELVSLGLNIEIDDFSAGNSSFTILPFIKASTVKLDMAVLPANVNSKNEVLIYDSLLSISRQLDMKIISEGVESKEQVDYLKTREVDGIQGFYYSRPLPFKDFVKLLKEYT